MDMTTSFISFEDANQVFLQECPGGFDDPEFHKYERTLKMNANHFFHTELPLERYELLLSDGNFELITKLLCTGYRKVKRSLMSSMETIAFNDGLKDPVVAARYATTLLQFLRNPSDRSAFESYASTIKSFPSPGRRPDTWPVLSSIPHLYNPNCPMLKPRAMKTFTTAMDIPFDYRSDLNWLTWSSLLDIYNDLFEKLAPLGARDYIDVWSWIWVVVYWPESPKKTKPPLVVN